MMYIVYMFMNEIASFRVRKWNKKKGENGLRVKLLKDTRYRREKFRLEIFWNSIILFIYSFCLRKAFTVFSGTGFNKREIYSCPLCYVKNKNVWRAHFSCFFKFCLGLDWVCFLVFFVSGRTQLRKTSDMYGSW